MTVVQTARKLGVNIMDYVKDLISQTRQMPSLADVIRCQSEVVAPDTS